MKRLFKFLVLLPIVFAGVACTDKNLDEDVDVTPPSSDTNIKSIYVYAENPDRVDEFDVSMNDVGDAFIFTTRALPMTEPAYDLTKVHIDVTVHKKAKVNVSKDDVVDFSDGKTFDLIVEAENGDKVSFNCSVVVTPPYEVVPEYQTTVTDVWSKTGTDMQLKFSGTCRGIAVSGDHFLILDNHIDNNENAKIKVYNRFDGTFEKNIEQYDARFLPGDAPCGTQTFPRSYTWTLECDEAGHIALGRLNSGGAGFFLDVWENVDATPVVPVILAADKVPDCAGRKMQLLGNVLEGTGEVILTTGHFYGAVPTTPGSYVTISMDNGVPSEPVVSSCAFPWFSGIVQKASLSDPTLYITGNNEANYPSDPAEQWETVHSTRFMILDPTSGTEPMELSPSNFMYRVLDAKVFELNGLKYYFTLQQGYSTGTGELVSKLYNITGAAKMNMKPGDEGYEKFLIYQSEPTINDVTGDWRTGNVAVKVDEESKSAMLYTYYPGSPDKSKVTCVKLQLGDEIK